MKKLYLIAVGIFCLAVSKGNDPDTVVLQSCLERITEKSTIIRQRQIAGNIAEYKVRNLSTNWYPSVGVNAQALYNSETIEFSDLLQNYPGEIPSLPPDQYKIWAEINQQIFDGGITKTLKDIERKNYEGSILQNDAEIHALQSQVSQVFFALIQVQNSSQIYKSSLELLRARKDAVRSGVNNGVLQADNLLAMEAGEISTMQKITGLRMLKKQLIKTLSILTDTLFTENSVFVVPQLPLSDENKVRPEIMMFGNQSENLELNGKLVAKGNLPKVFAFSQLAYGRPGYNMLSRDFHTFYTIGAGMKWNFLNYGDNKRQLKILESQKEIVDIRKKTFNDQIQIQIETQQVLIEKYDSLIQHDLKILDLRKNIAQISLSRLNNGIITSSDYLEDMNAELQARLQLESHLILKRQAEYDRVMIQGKLIY